MPRINPKEVAAYREKAERGDVEAMYQLGLCYRSRRGVKKDLVESSVWFRRAAEAGSVKAMVRLGHLLCKWLGCWKKL